MRNNKKGFTLVELLAVIVILALIMGIAVVSIGGVLDSARKSTMKETAVSIINGVRQQLTIANELKAGDYLFTTALLEKGGTDSPLGGTFKIATALDTGTSKNCAGGKLIGSTVCRLTATDTACSATTANSFVRVYQSGTTYTYAICLSAGSGNKYIDVGTTTTATDAGTEANLLDSNNNSMIK